MNSTIKTNSLIGKYFELINFDETISYRFKINHVKIDSVPRSIMEDGSIYNGHEYTLVSNDGCGWHRIYGGSTDRIVD